MTDQSYDWAVIYLEKKDTMPKDTFENLPEEKKELILGEAVEEFASNDYKNASISRIVRRAGIAKGSFYQYFESKKDLFLYLISIAAREKADFLYKHPPPDSEMNIFDRLRWLFSAGLKFEFSNPKLAQIGYRAIYGDATLLEESLEQIRKASSQFYTDLVQEGITQGVIRKDIDPRLAAFMFDAVFMKLGDYMLEKLSISRERLGEEGQKVLDTPEAEQIFNDLMMILESGMGYRSND